MLLAILLASWLCAVVPAVLFLVNLRQYREPRLPVHDRIQDAGARIMESGTRVAVLIPARDEERNIGACLDSVLSSRACGRETLDLQVLVLDDASIDATAMLVGRVAARDGRVRIVQTQDLPAGWNGKQRACWLLAQAAQTDRSLLLFLDADVRLSPDAIARCVAEMRASRAALLSGFPRQITVGWSEKMLLPLIHFVLLGYLPIGRMRRTLNPAFAAGCGQFFLVEREAYFASGGHAAIRASRHDGLKLPQLLRRHKYATDLVDLTSLAEVRMYDSAGAVWSGLAKNATEGLAAPARIVPFTLLLVLGQVVPALAVLAWSTHAIPWLNAGSHLQRPLWAAVLKAGLVVALVASYLPRLVAVRRFRQPLISALLHPLGVLLLLAVQWYALGRQIVGRPVEWRTRSYPTQPSATPPEAVTQPSETTD